MIEDPQIVQTTVRGMAKIHVTVPREQIRVVMGPGLEELNGIVARQGVAIVGPWFTHHLRMDPDVFDFEICVPVATPLKDEGRMRAGEVPAMNAARTVYHGSYEDLGSAWEEFEDWIEANGHTSAPDLWECYLVGPDAQDDPEHFRTELTRPLMK